MRHTAGIALVALTLALAGFRQADTQALQRMVATERAFAAATAEVGVRDGFLSFFADDAVQIRAGSPPTLAPARDALAAQSLQKLPVANQLIWEPFTGQVSSDGTIGWLTGGYVSLNRAQQEVVAQGAYFSVWKRQANGTWRVWLDEGITLPQIWKDAAPFRVAPEPDSGATGAPGETVDEAEASVRASADTWRARLAASVRVHVNGLMPIAGRDAVLASPRGASGYVYTVVRTEAAASGDLAVTIGGYEDAAGPARGRGTFVRVWKRDVGGRWRIVFQTETAQK
jgi:ketosteroid isomerase-like protein